MALNTLVATLLCTIVLPIFLFLVAVKLWEVYLIRGRDPSCRASLPPGSMGLPFIGETLQLLLQVTITLSNVLIIVILCNITCWYMFCVDNKQTFYLFYCRGESSCRWNGGSMAAFTERISLATPQCVSWERTTSDRFCWANINLSRCSGPLPSELFWDRTRSPICTGLSTKTRRRCVGGFKTFVCCMNKMFKIAN